MTDAAALASGRPRDRWSSRLTFIVASCGAAIGLGNVWRFPYLNYKHGGGAFLIPYVIFLLTTGIPMMTLEVGLGRLFQKGDIGCFGTIHRRARGVGTISVLGGFGVVTYYTAIIAWAAYYFVASFQHPFPWATKDCTGNLEEIATCKANPDQILPITTAEDYFLNTVLRYDGNNVEQGTATIICGPLFGALIVTWVVAYFCIWKGVRSVGKATNITVYGPWVMLIVLIIYNATLNGASDGVDSYIGEWDTDLLSNGEAWSDAAGQIFFSLGVALGIMTAYASYTPAQTNVFTDSVLISVINCGTSIFAGFAVFSILGNMAYRHRQLAAANPDLRMNICESVLGGDFCPEMESCALCANDDWKQYGTCCGDYETASVAKAGVFLTFAVYPATMQYLNKGAGHFMSVLWFGTLWLLGIDSMFAMVEGVATVITDTARFKHVSKERVALITCSIGFLVSCAFVTDIGLALLDVFDHYIINYGLMITAALEAYVVAWVWGWPEIRRRMGYMSAALFTGGFTIATIVGVVLAGGLHHEVDTGVNIGIGVGVGAAIFLAAALLAFFMRQEKSVCFAEFFGVVSLAGTRNLRTTFTGTTRSPGAAEKVMHIVMFDVMVKYICPPALLGLFVNQAIADATNPANNGLGYGGYPKWLQAVAGICVLGVMVFSLFSLFVYPQFWDAVGDADDSGLLEDGGVHDENKQDAAGVEAQKGKEGENSFEENVYRAKLQAEDGWGNHAPAPRQLQASNQG